MYKRNEAGQYELQQHRDFEFKDACPQFEFNRRNSQELLMFTQEEVCLIDYMQAHIEMRQIVHEVKNQLDASPTTGIFSDDQTKFVMASSSSCLYVDLKKNLEIDIDQKEEVDEIMSAICVKDQFYVLANKKQRMLGFYVFIIDSNRPKDKCHYLINRFHGLDITDCNMHYMRPQGEVDLNQMVISYKSIGINTFNIFVFDLDS